MKSDNRGRCFGNTTVLGKTVYDNCHKNWKCICLTRNHSDYYGTVDNKHSNFPNSRNDSQCNWC